MTASRLIRPLAVLACLLFAVAAQAKTQQIHTEPGSNVSIKVTSAFDYLPPTGYYPLRVTIANNTDREKTWTVRADMMSYSYGPGDSSLQSKWQQTLTVPGGQTRVFELLCAVIVPARYGHYQIYFTGPATDDNFWVQIPDYDSYSTKVFGLASETLRLKYGGRISGYLSDMGPELANDSAELAFYPKDWRGYAGVDLMWFQQADWDKLQPDERRPILQWVSQGGDLRILKDKGVPEDQPVGSLPDSGNGRIGHGAGFVRVYPFLDEEELFQYLSGESPKAPQGTQPTEKYSDAVARIYHERGANFWLLPASQRTDLMRTYSVPRTTPDARISNYYAGREVNAPLVILSMIAFGLIVGPLNFWVLARGRKRYRLLFTTPLISLGFCAIIAGFILISDGIGGEGQLTRLFIIPDSGGQEVLFEEQFARTGLLPSREFEPGDGVWVVPLGSRITRNGSLHPSGTYGIEGQTYWGSWFGSRRIQALNMTTVRPTRSGFEIQRRDDGELYVVSSFPALCPELYYVHKNGHATDAVYRAQDVATGRPTRLEPVSRSDFETWLGGTLARFSTATMERLSLDATAGHVYASVENYTGETPQAISSIDWHPYRQFVIAPAATSPASANAKEAAR
ncbi:hypothetical protein H5P28_09100 [Ruficoccus amylovorans]|uniref:Uncharacterized protein n=1 Tax=Ruficoccus amylovorans TaxID=1804625 RepID=A0A842HDA5_9BACT|nr:hypothetical protein [Ruficoccus amylovorans]MBC2594412.1 hypothetical protein [Ruficoccus amylovorans]